MRRAIRLRFLLGTEIVTPGIEASSLLYLDRRQQRFEQERVLIALAVALDLIEPASDHVGVDLADRPAPTKRPAVVPFRVTAAQAILKNLG